VGEFTDPGSGFMASVARGRDPWVISTSAVDIFVAATRR
jgi:hypothetical protein